MDRNPQLSLEIRDTWLERISQVLPNRAEMPLGPLLYQASSWCLTRQAQRNPLPIAQIQPWSLYGPRTCSSHLGGFLNHFGSGLLNNKTRP